MMDFNEYLRNDVHDWLSRPYSLFGWRLSGGRRLHGCAPAELYHAGLDFLSYHCMYLEPILAFLVDGKKPEADGREWTPAELTGLFRSGGVRLKMQSTMPTPDGLLVRLTLTNAGGQARTLKLSAYGEAERHIDPEAVADPRPGGKGWGKNFLHARHERRSDRHVVSLCYAETAESHRGGITNYVQMRVLRWHRALTAAPVGIVLPAGGQPRDSEGRWGQEWTVALKAGESREMIFSLAAAYHARAMPDLGAKAAVLDRARELARLDYDAEARTNAAFWQEKMEQVPLLSEEIPDDLKKMYYRAWTCIWQLVTPPFDTARMDGLKYDGASVLVTKADHRAVMPADWETVLGALVLNEVDPRLAEQVVDSLMASVEPDGYVPEALVFTKSQMLPFMTTYAMWEVYLKTGDKEWMRRHYETQKRSLWAHYRHPSFMRHGIPTVRNLIYVHIGFIYLHRIAEELELSRTEVEHCRWLVDETEQIVQNFWDDTQKCFVDTFDDRGDPIKEQGFGKESSVQCMAALFAGATAEQVPHMLKDLREKYLVGEYGIRESGKQGGAAPGAAAADEQDLSKVNTYKHSNFVYFIPGLERWDGELCRDVCLRTLRCIAKNGDFHEQMCCNADRRAFGPMAVFGAYGYIQCARTLSRLGLPKSR